MTRTAKSSMDEVDPERDALNRQRSPPAPREILEEATGEVLDVIQDDDPDLPWPRASDF